MGDHSDEMATLMMMTTMMKDCLDEMTTLIKHCLDEMTTLMKGCPDKMTTMTKDCPDEMTIMTKDHPFFSKFLNLTAKLKATVHSPTLQLKFWTLACFRI